MQNLTKEIPGTPEGQLPIHDKKVWEPGSRTKAFQLISLFVIMAETHLQGDPKVELSCDSGFLLCDQCNEYDLAWTVSPSSDLYSCKNLASTTCLRGSPASLLWARCGPLFRFLNVAEPRLFRYNIK